MYFKRKISRTLGAINIDFKKNWTILFLRIEQYKYFFKDSSDPELGLSGHRILKDILQGLSGHRACISKSGRMPKDCFYKNVDF